MTLHLGPGVDLPVEAATQTFGILGTRGSGKSNVAVVLAEEMWAAGIPWVAIDPKGDWWGLRSARDGDGPGLAVPVLGGRHGDVPLEVGAGAYVADLITGENLTCLLDVSQMSKTGLGTFLLTFAQRLFGRHEDNPTPRHVFLEEADQYVPQAVGREEGRLKEAVAKLVLQGRFIGLGATIASQRSARVHKDVLTQVETLIAMRTLGKLDRRAVRDWVTDHDVAEELVDSLPELADGEGWIWSPTFLKRKDKVRFRRRTTFDSGQTPKIGQAPRPPATLADVDLAAVKEAMATTIERAKADDPAVLRRRLADLEKQLRDRPPPAPAPEPERVEVPVPVLPDGFAEAVDRAVEISGRLTDVLKTIAVMKPGGGMPAAVRPAPPRVEWKGSPPRPELHLVPDVEPPAPPDDPAGTAALGKAERTVLSVLAQHASTGLTRRKLAFLAGYQPGGSTLRNALGALRSAGYVTRTGDPIHATPEGAVRIAASIEALPAGPDLYQYWLDRLGRAERAVLDQLVRAYPAEVSRADLAAATGYEASGSTMRNALGRLRGLDLVVGMSAGHEFMEAISG